MKTTILRLLLIYIGLFNNGTAFLRDVQLNRCVTLRDFAFEYSTFVRVKSSLFGIQKRQLLPGETSSYSKSLTKHDTGFPFDHFARYNYVC